jgi:uncharacterized protein YndB with AHSA1/START domain
MGDFIVTITIERPTDAVFAFLAEPSNMPLWLDAVDQVAEADDPPRRGARFEMTRSLPGGRASNDVEITEFDPNRQLTLQTRYGPTPFRYTYQLEPSGSSTRLTLVGRISGAGLPTPVGGLDHLATQLFKRGMKHNLRTLKSLLESGVGLREEA